MDRQGRNERKERKRGLSVRPSERVRDTVRERQFTNMDEQV